MNFISDIARSEKNISKKLNIPSLGNIPLNTNNKYLLIENNPKANMMMYIKDVRENIIKLAKYSQTISIISSFKGEGKSWIANNIAVSLSRINKKVLLIDANLRVKSKKSEIFYTEEGEGLSDFINSIEKENKLENLYNAKKYIKKTQIPNLYILPSGTITKNSYELLRTSKFKELLNLLKEMFSYIIIDGTQFYGNADCLNLVSIVDTNILVIEENKVTYKELETVKQEIESSNGEILGFILNKTDVKKGKHYAKENNQKLGIYIENSKEKIHDDETVEDIIRPIAKKLEKPVASEFEKLHNEIKDDILIEDFINDIEVNFNTKLENIEKSNTENRNNLIEKINKTEENIQETLHNYNFKRNEEYKNFEEFAEYMVREIKNLKREINEYKEAQEIKQNEHLMQILEEIKSKNYNEQFAEIKKHIENLNYKSELDYIKEKIESLNYEAELEEIKEQIENINYDLELEEIKEKIKNINYDANFEEIKNQIKELNKSENKNNNVERKSETKKSNIIDLRNLFSSEKVYSIDNPISFKDLEKMAVEVIEFDDAQGLEKKLNKLYN